MNATTPSPHRSSPASAAGTKRKRSSAGKYYAVKAGFEPGVYYEWNECLAQVTGYKGAVFQAFPTLEEANAFLSGVQLPSGNKKNVQENEHTRYYGIQRGRVPGVYTDWAKAQDQIKGFTRPRYKKFSTRQEAEEFVRAGQGTAAFSSAPFVPPGLMNEPPKDEAGATLEPGEGLLPPGAEDQFDPNVILDPATGKVVYKTAAQKIATKTKVTGPPGMLRIYTDGSSLRNGSKLASAGVGVYFGPGDERNVSEPLKGSRQTNQRAELTAILRAIDIAPRHRDVTIFTDSRYAIDCVTVWYIKWRRNHWMTADNKPVENKDLLKVKTLFQWIKGHAKDPGNEAADRLAVNGARIGVSEKREALEAIEDVPDEAFDDEEDI
ncbi:hypothetical protein ASPZODRAFT_840718 [Penicilliopsis zonata CBS 506.65]|uniref:ribonuclease H n=1 Tax=Penicilliopsis zonata CBS 506.65 TaxID=1073090 RepID=A0A1L9SAI5_9EURO|nr:hypothetical protein ASPZODRAFT_840718 [Penicilliopsis zonata CBS 506.65]OJJ44151.1 hypothetical protein ASPZODRAFT_840718 [Penicilliopsis zonata CBS 506.65]